MVKKKTQDVTETPQPENKDQQMTDDTKEDTTLAPAALGGALVSLTEKNPAFAAKYGKTVARVEKETPTKEQFSKIMDNLPEDYIDAISDIIRKALGSRKGVYADDSQPLFPELRIYHGTGNDPNRPDKQIPGEYYLTTKENVGEAFEGTVLAMWSGRTMWGNADAGESVKMPICQSMDRKMGSNYGDCAVCPHRPWRDGQQQKCSDDIISFMLSRDLKEIVLVRFSKTSEPTGKMLLKYVRRSLEPWSKWYKITAKAKTSKTDASRRWYVMSIEPAGGDDGMVDSGLHKFCDAMCSTLEATFILPQMSNIYRRAQEEEEGEATGGNTGMMENAAGSTASTAAKDDEDYGDMDDAPSV